MPKRDELVRFGVAMDASLLRAFDALVKRRASTRSEVLRDLARAEVTRQDLAEGADAVATVTLIYDHHVRDLTESLNTLQHALGGKVRSTMHVHLDETYCLEVIILQGSSDELRRFAERVFATRGVKHGGIEMVAASSAAPDQLHVHLHEHEHAGTHRHAPAHGHAHGPHGHTHGPHDEHAHAHAPAPRARKATATRRASRAR